MGGVKIVANGRRKSGVGWILPGFLLLWIINLGIPLGAVGTFTSYTQRLWIVSIFLILGASLWLWAKLWAFDPKQLLIGLVLAVLVWNPIPSAGTFFAYYAGFLVFRRTAYKIPLLKGSLLSSVALGVAIGLPLAAVNVLLSGAEITWGNPLQAAWVALNPGIHEEVVFRFFVFALCVYMLQGQLQKRSTRLLCLVLMVLPHVMLHFPDIFRENPEIVLASVVILSLLFGLPMAVLQRRRDLVAAMALHWFIDFIRFWLLGVPGS